MTSAGKLRNRTVNPLKAAGSGAMRITLPGNTIANSTTPEAQVSWAGVTSFQVQVELRRGGTSRGTYLARVGGVQAFVPAPGDIVLDTFLPTVFSGVSDWQVDDQICLVIEIDAAQGTLIPLTYGAGSPGDSGESGYYGGTTSIGSVGTLTVNGGSTTLRALRPLKIEIEHSGVAIAYIGDSRPNGKGDDPAGYGLARGGYAFKTALAKGRPITKFTRDGDRVNYWVETASGGAARLPHLVSYTDLYIDLGFNDATNRTAAQIIADIKTLIQRAKAVNPALRVHLIPIGPRTSSTSGNWLPPPDQTPQTGYAASGGVRVSVNAGFTAGQDGVTSIVDPSVDYRDSTVIDTYLSDGTNKKYTLDGAHFQPAGNTLIVNGVLGNHLAALS